MPAKGKAQGVCPGFFPFPSVQLSFLLEIPDVGTVDRIKWEVIEEKLIDIQADWLTNRYKDR